MSLAGAGLCATRVRADGETPASTGQAAPPDVVMLNDGSMIRGTISELIAGEKVTLITLTGETRNYPMAQVRYAGPSSKMPESTEPPKQQQPPRPDESTANNTRPLVTVRGAEARLKLVGSTITFHRPAASAIGAGGAAKGYEVMCTAPCEVSMPAGSYRFALSRGGDIPTESPEPITVPAGDSVVEAELVDRSATRTLGYVVAAAGAGIGFAIPFALFQKEDCVGTFQPVCTDKPTTTSWIVGTAVFGGGLIGGILMARTRDGVSITVRPGAPSAPPPTDAKRESASAPFFGLSGLSVTGVF